MRSVTLGEIADFVGGSFRGDRARAIRAVRPLADAGEDDLSFLANPKYEKQLATTHAAAVLVDSDLAGDSLAWIRVKNPYLALSRVLTQWFAAIPLPQGVSPLASIAPTAKLGEGVSVGPYATIADGCAVGDRSVIFGGTSIGANSSIGSDTRIHANVSIYHGTRIGNRCIIHSGAVIGSDGFGFVTAGGRHHKIPQIGIVRIEDDVEIGAGTTIDRAALGETVIGEGTKIDNLVQIAHNVKIGKHCLLAAEVGVAGSTTVGDYSVFGGQAGAAGHLTIGSGVMVAARSAVMKDFEKPMQIAGAPARPLRDHLRSEAMLRRLPKFIERLRRLERQSGIRAQEEEEL
jgi:UDP-3-O-[3-hydroxymyristoyl] glucosamine N-acyltransferase